MKVSRIFFYILLFIVSILMVFLILPICPESIQKLLLLIIPSGFILIIIFYEISESHRSIIEKYGSDTKKLIPYIRNIREFQAAVNKFATLNEDTIQKTANEIKEINENVLKNYNLKINEIFRFLNMEVVEKEKRLHLTKMDLKQQKEKIITFHKNLLDTLNNIVDILNNKEAKEEDKRIWEKNIKQLKNLIEKNNGKIIQFNIGDILEQDDKKYAKIGNDDSKSLTGKLVITQLSKYGLIINDEIIEKAQIVVKPEEQEQKESSDNKGNNIDQKEVKVDNQKNKQEKKQGKEQENEQ